MPAEKMINHEELKGVQGITKIEEYVNAPSRAPEFWDGLCDHAKWVEGYTKLSYRELDISDLTVAQAKATELKEAVAPDPSKITYKSYEVVTKDYGLRFPYTEKALRENHDDLERDIGRTLRYQATDIKENLKGIEFTKSRYTVTLGTGDDSYLRLFEKARAIMKKNQARGTLKAIVTTEVLAEINKELEAKGMVLPAATKEEMIIEGVVGKLKGFTIIERTDSFLYTTETEKNYQFIIFVAETNRMGYKAVKTFNGEKWEIIDNPLGSGVVKDKAGNIVADYNHQAGAVAANLKNFAAIHQADDAHLVCKVELGSMTAIDGGEQTYEFGAKSVATATSPAA